MKSRLQYLIVIVLIGAVMAMPLFSRSGVPRDALDTLAGYFEDTNDHLKKVVEHPPVTNSEEYRRAWAANQIQQNDRVLTFLKAKTSGWVDTKIPQAATDGLALAHRQVMDSFKKVPADLLAKMQPSFSLVNVQAVHRLALNTVGADAKADLNKAADSLVKRANEAIRNTAQVGLSEAKINRVIAGDIISGDPSAMKRQLEKDLREIHGGTVKVGKVNLPVGYYAEMVGRTKTRAAVVKAQHDKLEDLGLDLVMIIGRISTNFCTAFLGQVFSLSGQSDKYEAYSALPGGGPPFHPNCSKSSRPWIEELASEHQLSTAEGIDDAQKLLSMTPAEAQRAFKDLQIKAQITPRYATTAQKLFK